MGFDFGKLGDAFMKIGRSTLQTGIFYASTKAINNPCSMGSSVFGCGSFGGFTGYTPYSTFGCGMPFTGGFGGMRGSINDYYSQMALGQAAGMGEALAEQLIARRQSYMQQQTLQPTKNKAAEKFQDYSPEAGKSFESNTQKGETTQFVDSDYQNMAEGKEKYEKYKDHTVNLAKSYISHIDSQSGNKDNEITLEEFINYNFNVDNIQEADMAAYKQNVEAAFKKLDQNGDGKVDWKEMAALFSAFDSINDNKHDGNITKEELIKGTKHFTDSNTTFFDQKLRSEYTKLFGDDK